MFGWAFDIPLLQQFISGHTEMKFNTAFIFTLAGVNLGLIGYHKLPKLQLALSIVILSLGLWSIMEELFGFHTCIDELFFTYPKRFKVNPLNTVKMATTSALSFFCIGLGFLCIQTQRLKQIAQYFFHLVTLISFVALLGYFLRVPSFYRFSFLSGMALYTSIAFFFFSVAASMLNPELGLTGLFTGKLTGNTMAKKLFPSLSILILVLSFLRIEAHRTKIVEIEFGIALFATSFIVVGFFIIKSTALSLNKIDQKRNLADQKLMDLNENLKELFSQNSIQLENIFNSAHVSIISTDTTGIITNFNKGAEVMLGYKASEVIGFQSPIIIHLLSEVIERGEQLTKEYGTLIEGFEVFVHAAKKGHFESKEWTYIHKNGKHFPVQLVVSCITDQNKNITGYLGIATDISQLYSANAKLNIMSSQLQKKNAQLLNFAHITSHNLRSPVSNLNSLVYLYNEANEANEKAELFDQFQKVITHLTTTLNDLVQALQIQEDLGIEKEKLKFEQVFQKVLEIFAGTIMETHAKVSADFTLLEEISYPKNYLESIMLNLFSNALKYRSPERIPTVSFKTKNDNGVLKLIVKDNGLGIDLNKHGDKLFGMNKVFHRHPEAKGVGLFITKTQIEAMGGTIFAESEVEVGTQFTVEFNRNI
ncbi:MAG: PAS domain-containing sensor histidine kinase [Sphingobacteriia bacterium]|nr:MAG: PAS domain-containing sensor histidine kinase [Sphingobacteriia bacterium]